MEDEGGRDRPGGNVEPVSRAGAVKQQSLLARSVVAERFELWDPTEEVTYRAKFFDEIARTAERLGATKFVAITADGQRSTIRKVDGSWQKEEEQIQSRAPTQETSQRAPDTTPAPKTAPRIEAASARADVEAQRKARVAQIEESLNERYVIRRAPIRIGDVTIGQTEYRHRGDTSRIAFTESTFRLSTDNNSPSVARSMVDVAEARNWQALRVSGNEDFKRMVWLEASVRDVKTIGYEPAAADLQLLRKEREARQTNRIEPATEKTASSQGANATKESVRGNGGRKAVLAALEAVLLSRNVPEKQREAIMSAAAENLAQRIRNGETHKVKIYDASAPSRRPVLEPTRELQRTRERGAPTR
jgi:hypothetical protein